MPFVKIAPLAVLILLTVGGLPFLGGCASRTGPVDPPAPPLPAETVTAVSRDLADRIAAALVSDYPNVGSAWRVARGDPQAPAIKGQVLCAAESIRISGPGVGDRIGIQTRDMLIDRLGEHESFNRYYQLAAYPGARGEGTGRVAGLPVPPIDAGTPGYRAVSSSLAGEITSADFANNERRVTFRFTVRSLDGGRQIASASSTLVWAGGRWQPEDELMTRPSGPLGTLEPSDIDSFRDAAIADLRSKEAEGGVVMEPGQRMTASGFQLSSRTMVVKQEHRTQFFQLLCDHREFAELVRSRRMELVAPDGDQGRDLVYWFWPEDIGVRPARYVIGGVLAERDRRGRHTLFDITLTLRDREREDATPIWSYSRSLTGVYDPDPMG